MTKEQFSPKETEAIKGALQQIEHYQNAVVVSQVAVEISRGFNKHPFVQMEKLLREMQSTTYLIAIPLTGDMEEKFISMLPHSGDQEYPYYMWACVNGLAEAQEKMAEVGTNAERNLLDLEKTGLLVPRQGSQLSQMIQAPNN